MFRASPQLMRAALAIIRVVVGIVFVYHGWQKVFQMGHANVTGFFTQAHIPLAPLSAFIVMYLELLGGAALIVGLLARILGALFAFEMLVAIALVVPLSAFINNTPVVVVMNKAKFDALSPEYKEIIATSARETQEWAGALYSQVSTALMASLKKGGMTVIETDEEAFRKAVEPVYVKHGQQFAAQLKAIREIK